MIILCNPDVCYANVAYLEWEPCDWAVPIDFVKKKHQTFSISKCLIRKQSEKSGNLSHLGPKFDTLFQLCSYASEIDATYASNYSKHPKLWNACHRAKYVGNKAQNEFESQLLNNMPIAIFRGFIDMNSIISDSNQLYSCHGRWFRLIGAHSELILGEIDVFEFSTWFFLYKTFVLLLSCNRM